MNGDIENGRVAWPGQTINGCKISQAIAGGINSSGKIALWLFCGDGPNSSTLAEEVVVATPN